MTPLSILHLSDLHFGPNSRFANLDPVDLAERFCSAVRDEHERRRVSVGIHLALVTGDVADTAATREYEIALQFFEALASILGLDRRRFVFAPGNHDVSWIECKRAELDHEEQQGPSETLRQLVDGRKFKPFDNFLRRFHGVGREEFGTLLKHDAFAFEYRELGVSVVALNSCEIESHRPDDHRGVVSREQVQAAMDHWRRARSDEILRLALVHHNPASTVPESVRTWIDFLEREATAGRLSRPDLERFAADAVGLEGREHLDALSEDCAVQLLLHGHHHAITRQPIPWKGRKGQTHVLSAGSWGLAPDKLPQGQPNAVQLLLIDLDKKELKSWSLTYEPRARPEGKVLPGNFVTDVATPEGYVQDLALPQRPVAALVVPIPAPRPLVPEPVRRKLPDERSAITHKFSVAGHEGYITVGLYDDGTPGEVFITLGKVGSTLAGFTGSFATSTTLLLQYGVPLRVIVDIFTHTRFEPSGFTENPQIPVAKSIVDYVARWMAVKFLSDEKTANDGV